MCCRLVYRWFWHLSVSCIQILSDSTEGELVGDKSSCYQCASPHCNTNRVSIPASSTSSSSLTDDLLIPRWSCGCRAGWTFHIGSRLRRLLLCLGLAAHGHYWLVMASAGGGSLLFFPVLDGNLGRRWWGLLPSGSQLSSFRSRCRSNWADWVCVPGNVPVLRPAQSVL